MGINVASAGNPFGNSVGSSDVDATIITGQTAEATADDADLLLIYDNSASALKKMTRANFTSGLGGGSFPALTAGDLTVVNDGSDGRPFVASWSVADIVALGAVTEGTLVVATLPAKTVVRNVYSVITNMEDSGEGLTDLAESIGRSGAGYIDYIVATTITDVAANTILGNASGERGTNNTGYDFPSNTGTTDVRIRFTATSNLSTAAGSAGRVIIDYAVIP